MSALDRDLLAERAMAVRRHLARVAERVPAQALDLRPTTDASDAVILHLWQATQVVIAPIHARTGGTPMNAFVDRMLRAARLDVSLYEEVEREPATFPQALGVVVLASLAFGIGTGAGPGGLVMGALIAVAGWYVWAFITYFIGTRLLPEPHTRADHGELLRTIGFANAPGLISVLGVVPVLRVIAIPVAQIWMLVAGVIAIRTALDYRSTLRAVGVVAIGWLVRTLLLVVIFALVGRP